jgi:hypothetical protein
MFCFSPAERLLEELATLFVPNSFCVPPWPNIRPHKSKGPISKAGCRRNLRPSLRRIFPKEKPKVLVKLYVYTRTLRIILYSQRQNFLIVPAEKY